MRVLHVHSGNLYGGIETVLVTLARCRDLCPAMEPQFAVCYPGRLSDELTAARVPVHWLEVPRASRPATIARARRSLGELLDREPLDLVICHSAWSHAIFGAVARSSGKPLVYWMHTASKGSHWLDRWAAMTSPDLALCNSRFTAEQAAGVYGGVPMRWVHSPLVRPQPLASSDARRSVRHELHLADEATVIIQVGRMEALKGQKLCLEALGRLQDDPSWVCWQVGGAQRPAEGRYLQTLQRDAARLGIASRVRFLGERADVAHLMAAADIYCQPNSGAESFGLTFVEAMLAGLPVVTTAIGAAREIVDDSCGLLVAPDPEAVAGALGSLLRNRDLRVRLAAGATARAAALCDPRVQMPRIGALLEQVHRSRFTVHGSRFDPDRRQNLEPET